MALVDGTNLGDTLVGTADDDTIRGFGGYDRILGSAGNDLIEGGRGNDTIQAGTGLDTLKGGVGDDRFEVNLIAPPGFPSAGQFEAEFPADPVLNDPIRISGGADEDTLVLDLSDSGTNHIHLDWEYDQENGLIKSTGSVALELAVDYSLGYAMEDIEILHVIGADGDDYLQGMSGQNLLIGGGGDDYLGGSYGNDTLIGGDGDDILSGTFGQDSILGGDGDDVVYLPFWDRVDPDLAYADGGSGKDHLVLELIDDDDHVLSFVPKGRSTMSNGLVLDNFESIYLETGNGNVTVHFGVYDTDFNSWWEAGSGTDLLYLDLSDFAGTIGLELYDDVFSLEGIVPDEIYTPWLGPDLGFGGVDHMHFRGNNDASIIFAGWLDDTVFGSGGSDTLYGREGNDRLWGGDDDDELHGDLGHDSLGGGGGNDTVLGAEGMDTLWGGAGGDSLDGGQGHDLLSGGAGNDSLLGAAGQDTLIGGNGNDTLAGRSSADLLEGGNGADLLYGNWQNDTLIGGAGHDTLRGGNGDDDLNGGEGNDSLLGHQGNDMILGGSGDDTLIGGAGDDTLTAGAGNDQFAGGDGSDLFVFDTLDGQTEIIDFEIGVDLISFSGTGLACADLVFTQQDGSVAVELASVDDLLATQLHLAGLTVAQIDSDEHFLF